MYMTSQPLAPPIQVSEGKVIPELLISLVSWNLYIRYNHFGSGIDPSASARALTIDYRPSSIYIHYKTTMPHPDCNP